jgi:subfamily B ATP-binding cassette protein MsbA
MDAASTVPPPEARQRPRVVPVAAPTASGAPATGMRETARRLGRYVHSSRGTVAAGVVLFFASSAIDPLVPAFFKWLLDNGFKADFGFPIWMVPIAIVCLFMVRGALGFGGAYLFARATADAVLALRNDLVQSVMAADATLHLNMSPGVVATRVISDPQNAVNSLAGALTSALRDGTTLIALLAYLCYLNWQLTLVSLVSIPVLALVVRRVQARAMSSTMPMRRTCDS